MIITINIGILQALEVPPLLPPLPPCGGPVPGLGHLPLCGHSLVMLHAPDFPCTRVSGRCQHLPKLAIQCVWSLRTSLRTWPGNRRTGTPSALNLEISQGPEPLSVWNLATLCWSWWRVWRPSHHWSLMTQCLCPPLPEPPHPRVKVIYFDTFIWEWFLLLYQEYFCHFCAEFLTRLSPAWRITFHSHSVILN